MIDEELVLPISSPRIREMYEEFVDNFDPTPQYTFDSYLSLPDFDTWYHFVYLDL